MQKVARSALAGMAVLVVLLTTGCDVIGGNLLSTALMGSGGATVELLNEKAAATAQKELLSTATVALWVQPASSAPGYVETFEKAGLFTRVAGPAEVESALRTRRIATDLAGMSRSARISAAANAAKELNVDSIVLVQVEPFSYPTSGLLGIPKGQARGEVTIVDRTANAEVWSAELALTISNVQKIPSEREVAATTAQRILDRLKVLRQ